MKNFKRDLVITAIVAIICITISHFWPSFTNESVEKFESAKNKKAEKFESTTNVAVKTPLLIKYGEYKGLPIELEYDSIQKRLSLRLHHNWESGGDKELEVLKATVSEIFSEKKIFAVGNSEYSLHYLGGYPEWSPYHSYGPGYSFIYLLFSTKTTLKGNSFYVTGEKIKGGYYPYSDSVGVAL